MKLLMILALALSSTIASAAPPVESGQPPIEVIIVDNQDPAAIVFSEAPAACYVHGLQPAAQLLVHNGWAVRIQDNISGRFPSDGTPLRSMKQGNAKTLSIVERVDGFSINLDGDFPITPVFASHNIAYQCFVFLQTALRPATTLAYTAIPE